MSRLTEDDKHFGCITYGKTDWNPIRIVLSSGGAERDDGEVDNDLTWYCFGYCFRVKLPNILKPVVVDNGRYKESFARDYGFSYCDGFFQLFLGAQTHDSDTNKSWSCFVPWKSWRHIRHSIYDTKGCLFYQYYNGDDALGFTHMYEQRQLCPSIKFQFEDYDGKVIVASTVIEEREWKKGEKWCKWLSWFIAPKVKRTLDIQFSEEVGPEKGSWKGGTIGHSIEMLPGEDHVAAFKRYCCDKHHSRSGDFNLTYIGVVE